MARRLRDLRYVLLKAAGRTLDNVVFLEGGLGSQLVGMMMYTTRHESDPSTQVDVSYFAEGLTSPRDGASGLTKWPWELHRYGIDISLFDAVDKSFRVRLSVADQGRVDSRYMAAVVQREWTQLFPIVEQTYSELSQLGLDAKDEFACLHIRRGDYLRVSSKVVDLHETLALCSKIHGLLPRQILVASDGRFSQEELEFVSSQLPGKRCSFISCEDQHAVHGLMRLATVLVTSNSTFSWSAGLLSSRSDALVLSPQSFFGPSMEDVNRTFQVAANWMIMDGRPL